MRRIALYTLPALVLLGTGTAIAGDCTSSTSVAPDAMSGTLAFSNFIAGPHGTITCSLANGATVPGGYYGAFRVVGRGFANLGDGESAGLSVTSFGQTRGTTQTGPFYDDITFTRYYATGEVGSDTTFSGSATVDATNASDPVAPAEIDALDFAVGYTTLASVTDSINEVGQQQAGLITHLDLDAGILTGANQPLEGGDEVGTFGALGSYAFGATGRYNLAPGFSVLGGVSAVSLAMPGASSTGVLGAVALRYVDPSSNQFRLVGEAGAELGGLGMSFTRHYSNGTEPDYAATGAGAAGLGALYAKGGVLWQPDADNDVLFSASIKHGLVSFASYAEDDPDTAPNFFAADLTGANSTFTTAKLGTDWTHRLAPDVDLTASLALGATLTSGATAQVFGVGDIVGAPQSNLFTEYGLRVGWKNSSTSQIDGFVGGTTGTGIGTHVQAGLGYHLKF